jgi:hypothetical protein
MRKMGSRFVTVRTGAIIAASAAAAAATAWERTHQHVTGAVLTEAHMAVERLSDLRHETKMLAAIQSGLEKEWGSFAFLGFRDVYEMAAEAGRTIFVVVERSPEGRIARGIVQTTLTNVHGDAELLEKAYPSFQALTARENWKRARSHGGDTAVLLQITTLGPTDRGGGLGSLLRNAVLNMLPKQVEFALTTTPVDGAKSETIDAEDPSTYTPAMRFHARGGAIPARILAGYKSPPPDAPETAHGSDIVVMRYARDADGAWPAKRPPMRVRSVGPVQERILRTGRSLKVRGLKAPRPKLPVLHRPSLQAGMPSLHVGETRVKVISEIRKNASRLRHRNSGRVADKPEAAGPATALTSLPTTAPEPADDREPTVPAS